MVVAVLAMGVGACGGGGGEPDKPPTGTLDCAKTPSDPVCVARCAEDPLLAHCPVNCTLTPTRPECVLDCVKTPDDVRCAIDCTETPDDPECSVDCDVTPDHRSCQDLTELCDDGLYTLPRVRTGLCLADEEFYRDAAAPGGAFETQGTRCTIQSGILGTATDAEATASIACCLAPEAEVSPDCASCAAEVAVCSARNCVSACSTNASSPGCLECRETNGCEARVEACTGLTL